MHTNMHVHTRAHAYTHGCAHMQLQQLSEDHAPAFHIAADVPKMLVKEITSAIGKACSRHPMFDLISLKGSFGRFLSNFFPPLHTRSCKRLHKTWDYVVQS